MKKFLLSALVLIVFIIYVLHVNSGSEGASTITANTPGIIAPTSTTRVTNSTTPNTGRYKNGTYTGSVADAFYGNIQVQVTISGGRITDVVFLQYPNDRRTSQMINAQADPMLAQEAIQAQSANVSGVTGATASSGAFVQSLQSALQQAS